MNTQHWQHHLNKLGIFAAVVPLTLAMTLTNAITSASAQSVVIINQGNPYGVSNSPAVGSYIYGSPIPSPIPVNPVTGHALTSPYSSYPLGRTVVNPTLLNPVLVNPTIRNSTLVNPVIVNDQYYPVPRRGRSGIIFNYPY